jgi:hypothetical protein
MLCNGHEEWWYNRLEGDMLMEITIGLAARASKR